jgi:hypothetical protein
VASGFSKMVLTKVATEGWDDLATLVSRSANVMGPTALQGGRRKTRPCRRDEARVGILR